MTIKTLNEGFNKRYKLNEEDAVEPKIKTSTAELEELLHKTLNVIVLNNISDIKTIEKAFQDTIEKIFPDNYWWEVTSCNIFWSLFLGHDPYKTIEDIINGVRNIDNND